MDEIRPESNQTNEHPRGELHSAAADVVNELAAASSTNLAAAPADVPAAASGLGATAGDVASAAPISSEDLARKRQE